MLHDAPVAVKDEHAVVHVLQHHLVDARLRLQGTAALQGEALVRRQLLGEPAGDAARHEAADGEQARLHEAVDRRIVAQHPRALLKKERDGGERGVQEGEAARGDDRRADERHHQHHAQPAAKAAACIHEQRERHHVEQDVQRELQVEMLAHLAQEQLEQHRGEEISAADVAKELQRVRGEA